jgi:hypothetical protein
MHINRDAVMDAMRKADIIRMITGGCFLRHGVIKYFDYTTVGEMVNASIAHDHGFFVGNHPRDLTELARLREVLDRPRGPAWQRVRQERANDARPRDRRRTSDRSSSRRSSTAALPSR